VIQRLTWHSKLTEWSDDEDEVQKKTFAPTNKWAKIVIVKGAFTLEEIEEDKAARGDITEDMREEAEKFGVVTNVIVYDLEPEGIVAIRFQDEESASQFIEANHGRAFGGRNLDVRAAIDNPKGKFKKSARHVGEDEEEELLESLISH
jgi:HIV Tat-specific factor 1